MSLVPGSVIEKREFKSSSSNNIYTTILYDNCVSCNCPAGGRKSHCKHVEKLVADNLNLLLNEYPDFAAILCKIFSKSTDKETKKELYKTISYTNKDISAQAHTKMLALDVNFDKIDVESQARANKFIQTTINIKKSLSQALEMSIISENDYQLGLNSLKNSISLINQELKNL